MCICSFFPIDQNLNSPYTFSALIYLMENYIVTPLKNSITHTVSVPGSKSITNRAFTLAALAHGTSVLMKPLKSDDTKYMKEALKVLGLEVKEQDDRFIVEGKGGTFATGDKDLFLGNAGTAVRFLTAAMALRQDWTTIDGIERMRERPIQDLIDGLLELGAQVDSPTGCPPVKVKGTGEYNQTVTMRGDKSSQYFSALMQLAPCLPNGLTIEVEGDLVSKPYIDITIDVMKTFGVEVENHNYQKFMIPHQTYQAKEYLVEGDASAASYWFCLAAVTGSTITVDNIPYSSTQGDIKLVDVLEKMGCTVDHEGTSVTVTGPKQLKALGKVDMNAMPDVAMTLAVIAACADGETIIEDVANMRIKETDRITALVTEMRKMGIDCEEMEEGLIVRGSPNRHGAHIETYDDHRMAMCFAVLGSVTDGVNILDPLCCSKTYPTFFNEWENLKSI